MKNKWKSMELTPLEPDGTLPVSGNEDANYNIPSSVPKNADEVLIYVTIRNSNLVNLGGINFKIYTQEHNDQYAKYFYWDASGGNHVSYNSDNMWLPITNDRRIKCTRLSANGGTAGIASSISIIGYR